MSTDSKKRMGRPKKSPLEKGEQFSIRLPLMSRLELEVLARMKEESLSQAVERAIGTASGATKIFHEGTGDLSVSAAVRAAVLTFWMGKLGQLLPPEVVPTLVAKNPLAYRALAIPESVRRPGEVFFYQVMDTIISHSVDDSFIVDIVKQGKLDAILRSCQTRAGVGYVFEDYVGGAKGADRLPVAIGLVNEALSTA